MTFVETKLIVIVPIDDATDKQIKEWIGFETSATCEISLLNPLADYELEIEENTLEMEIQR